MLPASYRNWKAELLRYHADPIKLALAAKNLVGVLLTLTAFGKLARFGRLDYHGSNL